MGEPPSPVSDVTAIRIRVRGLGLEDASGEVVRRGRVRALSFDELDESHDVRFGPDGGASWRMSVRLPAGRAPPFAVGDELVVRTRRLSPGYQVVDDGLILSPGGELLVAAIESGDPGVVPGLTLAVGALLRQEWHPRSTVTYFALTLARGGAAVQLGDGEWRALACEGGPWLVNAEALSTISSTSPPRCSYSILKIAELPEAKPLARGRVLEAREDVWIAAGLDGEAPGTVVTLPQRGRALVIGAGVDGVELMPLCGAAPVGAEINVLGPLEVPTGHAVFGRVLNGLGEPIDGRRGVHARRSDPLAPPRREGVATTRPWISGVLIYDLAYAFFHGQAILAVGGTSSDRLRVAREVARHHAALGRYVVRAALDRDEGADPAANAVIVTTGEGERARAGHRVLALYTALRIAESLRDASVDVLLVIEALPRSIPAPWRRWRGSEVDAFLRDLIAVAGAVGDDETRRGSLTVFALAESVPELARNLGAGFDHRLEVRWAALGCLPPRVRPLSLERFVTQSQIDLPSALLDRIGEALAEERRDDEASATHSGAIARRARAVVSFGEDGVQGVEQLCMLVAAVCLHRAYIHDPLEFRRELLLALRGEGREIVARAFEHKRIGVHSIAQIMERALAIARAELRRGGVSEDSFSGTWIDEIDRVLIVTRSESGELRASVFPPRSTRAYRARREFALIKAENVLARVHDDLIEIPLGRGRDPTRYRLQLRGERLVPRSVDGREPIPWSRPTLVYRRATAAELEWIESRSGARLHQRPQLIPRGRFSRYELIRLSVPFSLLGLLAALIQDNGWAWVVREDVGYGLALEAWPERGVQVLLRALALDGTSTSLRVVVVAHSQEAADDNLRVACAHTAGAVERYAKQLELLLV